MDENKRAVPLTLRRDGAALTYPLYGMVLVLGGCVLAALHRSYPMLVGTALCLLVLIGPVVAWFRSRTRLGTDGILNRTVRGEEFIAWHDVIGVLPRRTRDTVIVIRRGGGATALAGLRGRRGRKGPDLDEVVAMIEARIGESPGEPRAVPPGAVLVRRLGWGSLRPALFVVAVLCVVLALYSVAHPVLVPLPVLLLGLAGLLSLATFRARTEIGPDGIRNRALRKEVFVPWEDVTEVIVSPSPPRTVKISHRNGARMTLAGLRDSDVHADGLGLDDVVEVIRRRARATDPEGEPETVEISPADVRPLSLRPARLPLVWVLPLTGALAGLAMFADGQAASFSYGTFLFLVLLLRLTVVLLRGRTDAGPDGLRNRLVAGTATVAWDDVDELVVVPSLLGRYARVTRANGRPITLAAPREGLLARDQGMNASLETMRGLAAASGVSLPAVRSIAIRRTRAFLVLLLVPAALVSAALGGPWLEPWWPARHEATVLPRACALVGTGTRDRLVPGWTAPHEYRYDSDHSSESDCGLKSSGAELELRLALERRSGFRSGTQAAADEFRLDSPRISEGSAPVTGLGDEASRTTSTFHAASTVRLLVRRHNVLAEVRYTAGHPTGRMAADADALARTVLSRIPDSH